jgi:hypothetical protein
VPLEMTAGNYSNVGYRGPVYKGLGAMNPCDNLHLHLHLGRYVAQKMKTKRIVGKYLPVNKAQNPRRLEFHL